MARKARKKEEDVESYRHETDKRKNAVPVGLASYDTAKHKPKEYEYNPHLDLQINLFAKPDMPLNFWEKQTGSNKRKI